MTGVLASARAELFVLSRRKVAWALVLLTPVLTVLGGYLAPYVLYRRVTPDQYGTLGTPSQLLGDLLPDQYLVKTLSYFGNGLGTAPFVVLGVVMAGTDWEQGTIRSALIQGPGRLRTLSGQVLAMILALTAATLLTFVSTAASALAVRAAGSGRTGLPVTAFPEVGTVLRGFGTGLLIAVTFGLGGLLLGTALRRVGTAVAGALLYLVVAAPFLDNLGYQVKPLTFLTYALPDTSGLLLTGIFYPGEDATQYYPAPLSVITAILIGWALLFLVGTAILVRCRDVVGERTGRRPFRRDLPSTRRIGGGAVRAELFVLLRWPMVRLLVIITPLYAVINSYGMPVIFYRTANSGTFANLSPDDILNSLRPEYFATTGLGNLAYGANFNGAIPALLLGALTTGTGWASGTVRSALLMRAGRTGALTAQASAVLMLAAGGVLLTFVLCGLSSGIATFALTGSVGRWPTLGPFAGALASGLLVSLAYTAIGLALGGLLRDAGAAAGVVLLWTVVVTPVLSTVAPQLGGWLLAAYRLLPDPNALALSRENALFDPNAIPIVPVPIIAATTILAAYAAALLVLPIALNRRRDVV